jgi:hypothetical protein
MAGRGGLSTQGNSPIASSGADLPQLLSDPKGVDWTPYLQQVLLAVRGYWNRIAPGLSSVRAGQRGYFSVQFAISRDGTVRKVAFSTQQGPPEMGNAAIASISANSPFGPLPSRYPDNEIHVQMNFTYNGPRY